MSWAISKWRSSSRSSLPKSCSRMVSNISSCSVIVSSILPSFEKEVTFSQNIRYIKLLYETAAWNFTDMIFAKPGLIETIQNILTYHQGDSIKCVAIDKQSYCIYEATFLNESAPCSEVTTRRNLTEQEILLAKIKEKIRSELADHEKYPIYRYDNYPLNWDLIPFADGYKFYAISGVSKGRAIPFGNDYLFIANKEGEIQSWKKFHSRLIPVEATEQMPMIAFPVHSHLKYEPFISATDICTFRLYYNKTGSTKFAVYSTALSMYFIYELATNTITPTKDINFNSTPLSEKTGL